MQLVNVAIETSRDGRVAVLRGVDTDAALVHLGQSLLSGAAFSTQRGLVIDLGGCEPMPATTELLREAGRARLRSHQVVTTVPDDADVRAAVRRVTAWIDRLDRCGADGWIPTVSRNLSSLLGVVSAGASIAGAVTARVVRRISS